MTMATTSPSKEIEPGAHCESEPARVVREVVADAWILGGQCADDALGAVRARIVDDEDLVVDAGHRPALSAISLDRARRSSPPRCAPE